jgi:hypothetical protein
LYVLQIEGSLSEHDDGGRRGFYLKWVDAPVSLNQGRAVYRIQFRKEDIESLVDGKYDHLCFSRSSLGNSG